jgi:antitoxin Phd
MQTWPVQDAKARLSEFLDARFTRGPQLVTKRGAQAAVQIPVPEWRRLSQAERPTLKSLLLSDDARHPSTACAREGKAPRTTSSSVTSGYADVSARYQCCLGAA